MNVSASIADVAGRQGFHAFEKGGFAWLHFGRAAEINFTLQAAKARLRLLVYSIADDYPTTEIAIHINGRALAFAYSRLDARWGWLETEAFEPRSGLNQIEIEAPSFIDLKKLDPTTADPRRLSVAVRTILLTDTAIETPGASPREGTLRDPI